MTLLIGFKSCLGNWITGKKKFKNSLNTLFRVNTFYVVIIISYKLTISFRYETERIIYLFCHKEGLYISLYGMADLPNNT